MLRDIIKKEKSKMNRIRFIVNYYIALPFAAFMIIGGGVALILMEIDDKKYLPIFLAWIGILVIGCTALLIATPIIRKKEILLEYAKKDFDISNVKDQDEFIFDQLDNELKVIFSNSGIQVNDKHYDYHAFKVHLEMSNYLLLVNLNVCFKKQLTPVEDQVENDFTFSIPLSKEIIFVLKKYHIQLSNQEDLEYILNNKEVAFKQIMTYGKLKK